MCYKGSEMPTSFRPVRKKCASDKAEKSGSSGSNIVILIQNDGLANAKQWVQMRSQRRDIHSKAVRLFRFVFLSQSLHLDFFCIRRALFCRFDHCFRSCCHCFALFQFVCSRVRGANLQNACSRCVYQNPMLGCAIVSGVFWASSFYQFFPFFPDLIRCCCWCVGVLVCVHVGVQEIDISNIKA